MYDHSLYFKCSTLMLSLKGVCSYPARKGKRLTRKLRAMTLQNLLYFDLYCIRPHCKRVNLQLSAPGGMRLRGN